MPRYAVLSDVHANLEALEAVLQDSAAQGTDGLVHLGDLVGYNANPRECLELLREKCLRSIQGNHDRGIFDPETAFEFNFYAREALDYSRSRLGEEDIRYLTTLPPTDLLDDRVLLCHGSPHSVFAYILDYGEARRAFQTLRKEYPAVRLCLYGHTHIPEVWTLDEKEKLAAPSWIEPDLVMRGDRIYLVNPGSVGQPRNGDPRAAYLVLDTDRGSLNLRLVPYDIASAREKILKANLPAFLATRLDYGI